MLADMLRYLPPAPVAPPAPVLRPGERIVALGDSITQAGGYLRMIHAVFVARYPQLRPGRILNAGVGGNQSRDMLARFDRDVLARDPQRVMINVGVNDVWHNLALPDDAPVLDRYRADVREMVRRVRERGCDVLLLAPTIIEERADSVGNRRLVRYVAAMKEAADGAGCTFCDLHALFLAALAANPRPDNWLTTDGVHMRPAGDAVMAIGVLRALGVPDDQIAATPAA